MERDTPRTPPDRLDADPADARRAAAETREPEEAARVRDAEIERTVEWQDRVEAVDRGAERTVESNADALRRNAGATRLDPADVEDLAEATRDLRDDVRRTRDAVRAIDPDVGA